MAKRKTRPVREVDELLEQYDRLEVKAEHLIEGYVTGLATKAPGIPRLALRQMTVDGNASGYSIPRALRYVRDKLSNENGR